LALGSDVSAVAPEAVDHERRFGGLARLHGVRGAAQIFASHVVVVGIGGVGSWSAEALARSGVGRITLIDMDHVSESNINRQIHSLQSTLGKSKIEAMRDRILDINNNCHVHLVDDFVTPENWSALEIQISQFEKIDGLIDACDQVAAKTTLAAWTLRQKKMAYITVGAAGGKQQAQLLQVSDLSLVTHDPLLAKVRYNLRRAHGAARQGKLGVACVSSTEPVLQPTQNQNSDVCAVDESFDGSLNCHGFGSSVAVTATFGMTAAGTVIRELAKVPKTAL
jgi:tRNA A37 threonylcarbamoyladenosine dehydratase